MFFSALLALATGVMPLPKHDTGRITVMVKHAGPPQEFTVFLRDRSSRNEEWRVIDEELSYYPKRPRTSPGGRRVTIVKPEGLQKYVQVCSLISPKPDSGSSSSFQVLFGLQSCSNLRSPRI